jgi:DNA invertase Pin-like site-specific DNA recombinase
MSTATKTATARRRQAAEPARAAEPAEVWADVYLRLSDLRNEGALAGRETTMREWAARLGVRVAEVIIENDMTPGADGKLRPASAFKRRKIRLPNGEVALRTVRPGFRRLLARLGETGSGVTMVLVEDLDRLLRQPRDGEDLLDAVELAGATVRSLSGSVTLTDGGTPDERFIARMMANVASKASADTSRRVKAARERLRGQSYHGGLRPFGFEHDPKAAKYRKTLVVVEAEAEVCREAAADVLDRGLSLRAVAAALRAADVPTVTGAAWTSLLVRAVLLKPAVAGLVPDGAGGLTAAPWEPIIPVARWERLRDKLTDPKRYTAPGGNAPKWLVSVFAECGICGAPVSAGSGAKTSRAYRADCGHVRRVVGDSGQLTGAPRGVDEFIAQLIVRRLGMADAAGLLRPAPARHVNAPKLRAAGAAARRA